VSFRVNLTTPGERDAMRDEAITLYDELNSKSLAAFESWLKERKPCPTSPMRIAQTRAERRIAERRAALTVEHAEKSERTILLLLILAKRK
jgi:hypothetical protein